MKRFEDLTEEELDEFFEGLDSEPQTEPWPTCTLKDGTHYQWDATLQELIEQTPDGRRFIADIDANKLVRTRELPTVEA